MKRTVFTFTLLALSIASLSAQTQPPLPEVNKIQQQEIIRRQELVFRAKQLLKEASSLEEKGDLDKAQENYRTALQNLNKSDGTKGAYDLGVSGLTRVNLVLAKRLVEEGKMDKATALVDEVQKINPENQEVKRVSEELQKVKKTPALSENIFNPALTPAFKSDLKTIETLFIHSEQFRRTGQYDKALDDLKKILSIDPYNKQAFSQLEKIVADKSAYAAVAHEQTREARITEVDEKWKPTVKRDVFKENGAAESVPITRSNQFVINQKLRSIVIPLIDFKEGTTIEDAVSFLNSQSKINDKDKQGITFILKPEVASTAKPFSLTLRNVPVGDALRYIAQLSNVKFKVEEFAVFIIRLVDTGDALLRRQFNVSPDFFPSGADDAAPNAGASDTGRRLTAPVAVANTGANTDVKESLMSRGVEFAPGSSAFYIPSSGVLSVINTQDQLDLIEELVNATSAQALMVDVQTKLVEINQEDLNELTFNLQFNGPNIGRITTGGTANPALDPTLTTPGMQTSLRGSQGLVTNNLDQILRGTGAPSPHLLNVGGFLNQRFFAAVISALAQKRSTDLLSSPSVRVKSGDEATIKVARTFFYPSQYDAPELVQLTNLNQQGGGTIVISIQPPAAIPAFPSEYESSDIGVTLRIRPQIGSDNRTVDLSLIPEVVDFEGFINYGTPITVPDRNGVNYVLTSNPINTPVFNRRKVQTKVFVRDGYTVVLGGLVREDFQEIKDKVPILGDIPLIGRAFRSNATKSVKKNLLIFSTARIMRPDGEPLNQLEDAAVAVGN